VRWFASQRRGEAASSILGVAEVGRAGCGAIELMLNRLRTCAWGFSSAGRAVALQASGRRFDPDKLHQSLLFPMMTDHQIHCRTAVVCSLRAAHL
jgi:hypothetical protein